MQISFTYQWFCIRFKLLLVSTLMLVQVGLHIFKRTNVIRLSSGQIKTVFKIVWVLYVLQIIGIVWQGNESINVVKLWMKKKCKQITEFRNSTKAKLFFIEHTGVTASTCFIKRMLKPLGHKRCLNVNSVSLMSPLYTPNSWISKILICCQCYFSTFNESDLSLCLMTVFWIHD